MKTSHALAQIRQLSCLGLGGEVAIPHMLRALNEIVPVNFSGFYWTDESGLPVNMVCTEITASTIDLVLNHYHLLQQPGELSVEALARGSALTGNLDRWYAGGRLERTVAYNEIFTRERSTRVLDAVVRSAAGPRGLLLFGRSGHDRRFSAAERRRIGELTPWFLHALAAAPDESEPSSTDGERTVILCDIDGNILASDPAAAQTLLHLGDAAIAPGMARGPSRDRLPSAVRGLCWRAFELDAGRPAEAPVGRVVNRWGAFTVHAHMLRPRASAGEASFALSIIHERPRAVRILDRLKTTSLSPRQRQLALLLSMGREPEQARQAMEISRKTYRDYVERIYERLEVHSRSQLAIALNS